MQIKTTLSVFPLHFLLHGTVLSLLEEIHAVWLQELDYGLGQSIYDNVMDPESGLRLEIRKDLLERINDDGVKQAAKKEAKNVLADVRKALSEDENPDAE